MPVGSLTVGQLRDLARLGQLDTVLLAVPDLQGRLKGKAYAAGHFVERVLGPGAEMCAYLLATDVDMRPVDGFALTSWEAGYQDLRVVPDPETLRMIPWMPRTALMLGTAVDAAGMPLPVAPRQMLREQLDRLAEHDLHVKVGVEAEFVVCRQPGDDAGLGGEPVPVVAENLDYALDHPPALDRYLRRLQAGLLGAGRPVEAIKTEAAPGQVEVTFPYGDPLKACDGHLLLKHAARRIGARSRLLPTFMAAPVTGVGSGLHLHLSLWRDGRPLAAPGEGGGVAPVVGRAIAGLLAALPELAVLYAPNTNSYRRYTPDSFAPTRMVWGRDNRTCAVRMVGHAHQSHLEIRVPGADANPYLALAAVVAAIRHGLEHDLPLPPAHLGSAYAHPEAPRFPPTLNEAEAAFRSSKVAEETFGKATIAHYARLAQIEIEHARTAVPDTERARWLTRA
ncbi:glutamine synthetase family protein [Streptomyces sp. NPDC050085]